MPLLKDSLLEFIHLLDETNAELYLNDVNASDQEGKTLLYRAAARGEVTLINLLVKHGGDINRADNDGWTPVHIAALRGNFEAVKRLVDLGVCLDKPGNFGWTLAHRAAIIGSASNLLITHFVGTQICL